MEEQDIDGVQAKPTLAQEHKPGHRHRVVQPMPLAIEARIVASREELEAVNLWKYLKKLQRNQELEELARKLVR